MGNQEEKLKQEILQESEKKAERLISRAQRDCEQAFEKAQKENEARRADVLAEAKAEAQKKCRKMVLDMEYECRRNWLLEREECIDALLGKALSRAESLAGADREKSYVSLVKEAVAELGTSDVQVVVPAADADLVTVAWLEGICPGVVFTVSVSDVQRPGLVFSAREGAVTFDNTYATRLHIMRESFRERLAAML